MSFVTQTDYRNHDIVYGVVPHADTKKYRLIDTNIKLDTGEEYLVVDCTKGKFAHNQPQKMIAVSECLLRFTVASDNIPDDASLRWSSPGISEEAKLDCYPHLYLDVAGKVVSWNEQTIYSVSLHKWEYLAIKGWTEAFKDNNWIIEYPLHVVAQPFTVSGVGQDAGNAYPTVKKVVDALVSTGIVPNDTPKYVGGLTMFAPKVRSKADALKVWLVPSATVTLVV